MPPGQPVHRCKDCRALRPTKRWWGKWLCVDCSPLVDYVAEVATDGGEVRDV